MRYISLLLIAVFISLGALAQEKKKMNESHQKNMMEQEIDHEARAMIYADKMATRLNLNLEQKDMVQKAEMERLEEEQKLMMEMMHQNDAEIKEHHKQIETGFKDEMKTILSSNQYEKWKPMYEREMKMHNKKMYNKKK